MVTISTLPIRLYDETGHWHFCSICQSRYFEDNHNIYYMAFIDVHDVSCSGCGWKQDNPIAVWNGNAWNTRDEDFFEEYILK